MELTGLFDFVKNFGFPIAIAVWAIWRLDNTWSKGSNIHATLSNLEDDVAEVKEIVKRVVEIQTELVTTMKIIQTFVGGESRK
jgi:hypothetical protein